MAKFDKEWKTRLSDLATSKSDKLTGWEFRFVDKLNRLASRAKFGWEPSPKQMKCLEKIWAKVFG
jgi:hypothetical protein